jgi:hypothetical protein
MSQILDRDLSAACILSIPNSQQGLLVSRWAGLGLLILLISDPKSTLLIDLLDHNGAD